MPTANFLVYFITDKPNRENFQLFLENFKSSLDKTDCYVNFSWVYVVFAITHRRIIRYGSFL